MSYKLYVGNLPTQFPEEVIIDALRENFSPLGTIEDLFIIRDKLTNMHRGFGFITIKEEQGARRALAMAGKILFAGCEKGITMDVARERRQQPLHIAAQYPSHQPTGYPQGYPQGYQQSPMYAARPPHYGQHQQQPPFNASCPSQQMPYQAQMQPLMHPVDHPVGPHMAEVNEDLSFADCPPQLSPQPLQREYESASWDNNPGNFKDEWEGLPA